MRISPNTVRSIVDCIRCNGEGWIESPIPRISETANQLCVKIPCFDCGGKGKLIATVTTEYQRMD